MARVNWNQSLTDTMRRKGRRVAWAAVACLLAKGVPAASQTTAPDYSGFRASACIPFASSPQSQTFTEAPKLKFSVAGGPVRTATMDTGSVGIALAYDQIPNYEELKGQPGSQPGYEFLSSSKVLWVGTWVRTAVTFYDESIPVATASVPVLGVELHGVCPDYQGNGVCPDPTQLSSAEGSDITYMGVGFGQEADFQPQGTPDKNPFLNLTTLGGRRVRPNKLNKGYIIGGNGVTVGLTAGNAHGFQFIKLAPYAQYKGDWSPASMCVRINGSRCFPGTVLVDTGVSESYMTLPLAANYSTVVEPDDSDPSGFIQVLADGTTVGVSLPGVPDPVAVDWFTVGDGTPLEPRHVIPWQSATSPTFVNTGRHFLRRYQLLYDARNGYIGVKSQTGGCGG